ncbi:efflux RND transporter periplasmic adaptor subunit [Nitratireductor basaltis]|uniref:Efflux transporter, RND family, MFP subunit n=1 Tax=Nitratireductor basaltis TaxID=472175 RepID=A0A084U825_9HYPH|nr:efflux RND transporter periplasmic adaptor subunit [Nitratireductor basaltis]KFB09111.1 Efflux transporter, RND family, MFP subunit precursor [Nitratireductor basaltis]
MKWWKQAFLSLMLLIVAGAGWYLFFPGAKDIAARWGLEGGPAAAATSPDQQTSGRGQASGGEQPGRPGGRPGGRGRPGMDTAVVAEPVTTATINDRLSAIGTGRAQSSVEVRPFASGRITEMTIEAGARVDAGDVIARLDSDAETIALDRAKIALEDAQATLKRISALRSSNTVTAVQQTEAELAVRNAELALRDAELNLSRRIIAAPIAGVVGILPVSQGAYVTTSDTVAQIEDRSSILVDFWIPERYAQQVATGMALTAQSVARPAEAYEGEISAIDNQIDSESRTLRVQGKIANAQDRLRSGMAFKVTLRFDGDLYAAVPPLAIQWGNDGAYVWAVVDGVANQKPVKIVQRNTDSVLVDADFVEGTRVVTEGVHAVREGSEPRIAGDAPARDQRGS